MPEIITYPRNIGTPQARLYAVYSLLEQARLWINQQGEKARNDPRLKGQYYVYGLRPWRLGGSTFWKAIMPLLEEQNRLKEAIRKQYGQDLHLLEDSQVAAWYAQYYGEKRD